MRQLHLLRPNVNDFERVYIMNPDGTKQCLCIYCRFDMHDALMSTDIPINQFDPNVNKFFVNTQSGVKRLKPDNVGQNQVQNFKTNSESNL